jgi:hypothetical protein
MRVINHDSQTAVLSVPSLRPGDANAARLTILLCHESDFCFDGRLSGCHLVKSPRSEVTDVMFPGVSPLLSVRLGCENRSGRWQQNHRQALIDSR